MGALLPLEAISDWKALTSLLEGLDEVFFDGSATQSRADCVCVMREPSDLDTKACFSQELS